MSCALDFGPPPCCDRRDFCNDRCSQLGSRRKRGDQKMDELRNLYRTQCDVPRSLSRSGAGRVTAGALANYAELRARLCRAQLQAPPP